LYTIVKGIILKVDGGFTRNFAIIAMKKDITIKLAIFDLIDNSIEAAEKLGRIRGHKIAIIAEEDKFSIKDDCGGLNPKLIREVFKIGGRGDKTNGFGVGMKRAIIKLGNKAEIFSYNDTKSFHIPFDVGKWGYNDDWSLDIRSLNKSERNAYGVEIYVEQLEGEVKRFFRKGECNNLSEDISKRYRMFLEVGMEIILNGKKIKPYKIKDVPDKISPKYVIQNNINVQIRIYSTIDIKEENGWDIFINNKCICETNKSKDVQWNKTKQETGYSYRRFRGEVLIEGVDVIDLPLNSTKDKIDFNSEIMNKIIRVMYNYLFQNKQMFKKQDVKIQFDRDISEVDILKDYFDEKTAKATGERAFDIILGIARKI
jgi:hypothetical protein